MNLVSRCKDVGFIEFLKQQKECVFDALKADHDQAARIKRLESELRRVNGERDILKKAAAYFAKESRYGSLASCIRPPASE